MKDRKKNQSVPAGKKRPPAGMKSANRAPRAGRGKRPAPERILNYASDGIFRLNRNLQFEFANPAALHFLGLREESYRGTPIADFLSRTLAGDVCEEVMAAFAKRSSATVSAPYEYGGRQVWFEAKIDAEPSGWICVLREISSAKRAAAVLEQERYYHSLFDALSEALFVHEINPDGGLRRIIEANEAACRLLGRTRREILAMPPAAFEGLGMDFKAQDVDKRIRSGEAVGFESVIAAGDGRRVPVQVRLQPAVLGGRRVALVFVRDVSERERAERALAESEDKFRYVFENSVIANSLTLASGRLDVNRAFCDLLGYTREELRGKTWREITHPDDIAPTQAAVDSLLAGEKDSTRFVKRYLRKDGTVVWAEVSTSLRRDPDGAPLYFVTSVHDVTERKLGEEALQASEARFRFLFETTPDSLFIIDRDTLAILAVNPAACRLYGYTAEEFVKMRNVDVSAEPGKTKEAVDAGSPAVPVRYHRKKDGTVFPVEITGGYFEQNGRRLHTAFIRDISERRRLEEALEKDRREMQLIIDASPIIIFYKDRQGRFVRVNKAFTDSLKLTADDLIGKTVHDLYSDDIARGMTADDREVFETGRPKLNIVERYTSADGLRWVRTDKTPIFNEGGEVSGLIGFAQDITDEKAAEDALLASEKRFRALIENSSDAISLVGADGTVLYNSPSYCRLMGYPPEDRIGRNTMDLVHPEDRAMIEELFAEIIRKPGRIDLPPLRVRHADGSWRWIEGVGQNLIAEPGIGAIVVNFRDITERRLAEEALKQSEARFRLMFQYSAAGLVIVGTDFRFQEANPSFCRMLGYTEKELQAKTFQDVTLPDDRQIGAELTKATLNGEREMFHLEKRYVRKDGAVIWGMVSSTLVRDQQGRPLHFVTQILDITERREAEEALRQSEARFRDLAELLPQTIYETDLEGRIAYVNRSGLEASGYSEEDMRRGFNLMSAIVPEDRDRLRDVVRRILSGEKIAGTAYTVQRKDGSTFPVLAYSVPILVDGRPRGLRGLVVDVSEQKMLERELAETKAILETAFKETPIPMVMATAPDNVFRLANHAALELLGAVDEEDHLGKTAPDFVPSWQNFDARGNPIPFSEMPLPRALRGEAAKNELYYVRRKDGTIRWELVSASPVRNEAGEVIAAFTVFPDVTERINTEEELKKQLKIEQLAADISAEFVNVAYDQIDAAIRLALKKTTLYAGARIGSLFMVTPDGSTVTNTHEWCVAPEDSQVGQGQGPRLPAGIREFHLAALSRNRAVSVGRLDDYPADEEAERELAEKYGFRPFVLAPLFRSGELIGTVGVYGELGRPVDWPAQLVTLLGLIGDMIVNLLDRKQAEAELHLYREHLEELVAQRTEELERSRAAAIKLMETATAQRQRAEEALRESNRMAEALKESQTRLRLATSSAQIGIVETDLATGELLWDETCAAMHGLPPGAPMTLERYLDEFVHPEDRAAVRNSLFAALAGPGGHWGREYRILRPDGGDRWITEDHFIIRDASGSAARLIGAKQDVTVRKRAEAELRRAVAEKETLIREIHHRVKNNLNTISNLIYFQTKLLKDKQAIAAFRDSQNRIQSMARIHEHLYRSWDLSRVDMKAYFSDLVVDLSQTYGIQTTRLDLSVGDLALDIDQAVPCGLIMNELVSNSMKYAFDKSRKDNKIAIRLAHEGERIVLEVADNGIGLPENWDLYSATSLGIRLVNMFCKQLAGELSVKSAPGEGTSFRISFGRTKEEPKP
jgi:PAS domain S-box-containing protein